MEDVFAIQISRLVYEELHQDCEGCEMDDPSQLHHTCCMMDEEEVWSCHYEKAKRRLNLKLLWANIETCTQERPDLQLNEGWFKYFLHLISMDARSAYLIYKTLEVDWRKKMKMMNV